MSCPHGNWHDCEACNEIDKAYALGKAECTPTTPAMDVKRYRLHTPAGMAGAMADFVLASAFDALSAENARLRREAALAHELRNQIADENKRLFGKNLEQQAEVGRLRADAQRYRWLRDTDDGSVESKVLSMYDGECMLVFGPALDSAIDSAMALAPSPTNSDGTNSEGK